MTSRGSTVVSANEYKAEAAESDPYIGGLAEHWVGTHCDGFVVSMGNGLGRQAAAHWQQ